MAEETQLDKDLVAAKQRVAKKRGSKAKGDVVEAKGSEAKKESGRHQVSDEERQRRQEEKQKELAEKRAERERVRAEKKAERDAHRAVPHISKVKKAAEQLPDLSDSGATACAELLKRLSTEEINVLGQHLQHIYRARKTEEAINRELAVGQQVKLIGGPARFVGQQGTIISLNRIRCYVKVAGFEKPVYVFTSETADVVPAKEKSAEAS